MEQRTPARKKPTPNSFDTRPTEVQSWVAGLPLANLGESSRLLFGALVETNALDIPAEQRLRLLEAFDAPTRALCDGMKAHFVGKAFPLPERARQIVQLSQALMTQMAAGYRIVAEDSSDKRGLLGDHKQPAVASHRALSYLGEALLRAYQVYAPYPAGIWQQVHSLYQQAEAKGFAGTIVKGPGDESGHGTSIEDAYKRILLLALACPYRLRQGEVEQIYAWLREWSRHASLDQLTETKNPNGLFVANFAADEPPTYLVLRDVQYDQASCRLLNATRLADVVREVSHQWHAQTGKTPKINEQVLRRLMLAWGVMPKRRFSRSQRHSTAMVAIGLSAAHYYTSGEVALEEAEDCTGAEHLFSRPARFEASDTADRRGELPELWEMDERPPREIHSSAGSDRPLDFSRAGEPVAAPARVVPGPAYRAHVWKMVNVSAGGYRLLWDSSEGSQAQVGELLGLQESAEADSFHLSLGVVRWMKHSQELGLELGVEMLSPGAVAVGTRADKAGGGEYMRSLLLPAVAAIGQPATLLTPALPYHVGDVMIVNSHGNEARVELTKLVENTGTFAQYPFKPLDSRSARKATVDDTDPAHFADLWNKL